MKALELKVTLTVDDWLEFQQIVAREVSRKYINKWFLFFANAVIWFLFAIILMSTLVAMPTFHWPTGTAVAALFVLIILNHYINVPKLRRQSYAPTEDGAFCESYVFELDEEKMKVSSKSSYSVYKWDVFKRVKQEGGLLVLFVDTSSAVLIPIRDLENSDEVIQFLSEKIKRI